MVWLSAPSYSLKIPTVFLERCERMEYQKSKLRSYCIALVHLPNKMKGLTWRHLRKTPWQTRPTRGCRCPAKTRVMYLTCGSGQYLKEEKKRGKERTASHCLLVPEHVSRRGAVAMWPHCKVIASNGNQTPSQQRS